MWKRVENIERLSSGTQSITDKFINFRKKLAFAGICCEITYGLSDLSRQALSIPGNDIMASISLLELGFLLLWGQKTNSQPQLKGNTDILENYTIITTIIT